MRSAALALLLAVSNAWPAPAVRPQPRGADAELCGEARSGTLTAAALLDAERRSPGRLTDEEASALETYYTCRAAAGAPEGCEPLSGLASRLGGVRSRCARLAPQIGLAWAAHRGSGLPQACSAFFSAVGMPGDEPALCEAFARAVTTGRYSCGELEAKGLPRSRAAEACRNLGWVAGAPSACPSGRHGAPCRELAGLAAGFKSREACSTSAYCRAASAGLAGCEDAGKAAVAVFARRLTSDKACARGARADEDTPETRERREREAAEWKSKDAQKQARDTALDLAKQNKTAADRQAADAQQRVKDERLSAPREAAAAKAAGKRQFSRGEPMRSRPKWLEKAIQTGQPPKPEDIKEEPPETKTKNPSRPPKEQP